MFAITPLKTDTIYILAFSETQNGTSPNAESALLDQLTSYEIDGVFTSPADPAKAIIAPFVEASGLTAMVLPDLRDHRLSLQGNRHDDPYLETRFTQRAKARPGGEPFNGASARLRQAILSISRRPIIAPLMVTHTGLLAALLSQRDKTFGYEQYLAMKSPGLWKVTHRNGTPTQIEEL